MHVTTVLIIGGVKVNLNEWTNKNNIPDTNYLLNKTLKYIQHKDWYKKSNKTIKQYYPKNYNLFIDILAITSPITTVKSNVLAAIMTVDTIKYKRDNSIIYGLANKQIRNSLDRYNKTKIISGIKTTNFANSLRLISDSVCIDTWILKAFNLKRRAPTKYDIKYITTIIKRIACMLGIETYEVQACLWVYAKTELNGTGFKKSHDISYYLKAYFEQTQLNVRKIKVLKQIPLNLKEKCDDAIYEYHKLFISLNLPQCKKDAQECNIDFYEYVARCINHEFLHYVLHMEHGYDTCYKLDKIAHRHKDFWMW